MQTADSIFRSRPFLAYLTANSSTQLAFAMQHLFVSWILIGMLDAPGARVGLAQALTGIPGLFLMLWGGASADRKDARLLLLRAYALGALIPVFLLLVLQADFLNFWTVTFWATLMGALISYTNPAQTAILNRAAAGQIQEAVTAATAVGFVVQVLGIAVAGQMETVGLSSLLLLQAVCTGLGAVLIAQLKPAEVNSGAGPPVWQSIAEGLGALRENSLLMNILALNFISMMFNAGSFLLVLPFILTKIYGGDAAFLSWMLVVFFAGGALSNFILLRFMPLRHPGQTFLVMQASRVAIFLLYWIQPTLPLLILATFLWGMNMGVTTTTSRTIVQESAPEAFRARILSVYSIGLLGAQPLGALLLGWATSWFGILNSMLPGVVTSLFILVYGIFATSLWRYVSPQVHLHAVHKKPDREPKS